MKTRRRGAAAALLAAALASPSSPVDAKVVFTGYGDLRYSAAVHARISGTPATLTALGVTEGAGESRAFSADALGLFASTSLDEDLEFLMDLTFKGVGNTVAQTRLQYAYLHWKPREGSTLDGGRVTLPFGYFNENRFYAFHRPTITPPVFQSGILGLPLSDWGVVGKQRFPLAPFTLEASAYAVNGYGNSGTNATAMRLASAPGGLSLSNNLRASDNNHQPAVGGRLSLLDIGGAPVETGASYYWGTWDPSGVSPMRMLGAHAHAKVGGLDLLAEFLHLGVRDDRGFASSIGDAHWTTNGAFATVSYDSVPVKGKALVPFAQGEYYRTRPNGGGTDGEVLYSVSAGAALRARERVTLKAEYLYFLYDLPDAARAGSLRLRADGALLSAVVTF